MPETSPGFCTTTKRYEICGNTVKIDQPRPRYRVEFNSHPLQVHWFDSLEDAESYARDWCNRHPRHSR